jgi:hypothetical protein
MPFYTSTDARKVKRFPTFLVYVHCYRINTSENK